MKEFIVDGFETKGEKFKLKKLKVFVTADKIGKTLSVRNNEVMFTIALEPVLEAIRQEEENG